MSLIFSYAASIEISSKVGTNPSANTEIDSKFLEQSIGNTLTGAKTFRVSTPVGVSVNLKKVYNLTELAGLKYIRAILIKSSELVKVDLITQFTSGPNLTQSFRNRFAILDFGEATSNYISTLNQSSIEVTNLSSTTSADVTLIVVGY